MILECENLSKNYGGLRALDELNFKLESGKIVDFCVRIKGLF